MSRANLRIAAGLHLSFGRCSWTACRAGSSRCNGFSAHRSHLETLYSVPHRASDKAAPWLHLPFRFHVSSTQRSHFITNIRAALLTLTPKSSFHFQRECVLTRHKSVRKERAACTGMVQFRKGLGISQQAFCIAKLPLCAQRPCLRQLCVPSI